MDHDKNPLVTAFMVATREKLAPVYAEHPYFYSRLERALTQRIAGLPLHEQKTTLAKFEAQLDQPEDTINAKDLNAAIEMARTHILAQGRAEGIGNRLISAIPHDLTRRRNLKRDTLRADAVYTLLFGTLGDKGFLPSNALSALEKEVRGHIAARKDEILKTVADPMAFRNAVRSLIPDHAIAPPNLASVKLEFRDHYGNPINKTLAKWLTEIDAVTQRNAEKEESAREDMPPSDPDDATSPDERSHKIKRISPRFRNIPYKIFTTANDEEVTAAELLKKHDTEDLRAKWQDILNQKPPSGWSMPDLATAFDAPDKAKWRRSMREGDYIDPAALSQIVAASFAGHDIPEDIYIQREQSHRKKTTVTLLLDNSGSMRGVPAAYTAHFALVVGNMLHKADIPFEILGFTTRMWKGGQSREKWHEMGRPMECGRMNDLRHIIYKSANDSWTAETASNLRLMLAEGMLKENIDGEALIWAHDRITQINTDRRIIIPVSDGAPVDDSTSSANSGMMLEDHLKAVIKRIEAAGLVELHAVGINHNPNAYYHNSVKLIATTLQDGKRTPYISKNPWQAASDIMLSIARFSAADARRAQRIAAQQAMAKRALKVSS